MPEGRASSGAAKQGRRRLWQVEDLVMRPGRDRGFYLSFMAEDHFPMTTFRLYDDEKQDVVEYLLSLQNR